MSSQIKWIINTRPQERAKMLSQSLQAQEYQVYDFPLLALHPLPLEVPLRQQFIALLEATIVIVVSPTAAHIGMDYAKRCMISTHQLQQKCWISVGKTTQAILREYGIDSFCPDLETSEGMLQLPALQQVLQTSPQCIAFWRGVGGREILMQQLMQYPTLSDHKHNILNMCLYTRACPDYTMAHLHQLKQHLPAYVLISSLASWNNWQYLIAQLNEPDLLTMNHYLVLAPRVSQQVKQDLLRLNGGQSIFITILAHLDSQHLLQFISHQGMALCKKFSS